MSKKQLSVRLDLDLSKHIEEEVKVLGLSKTTVVEHILREYYEMSGRPSNRVIGKVKMIRLLLMRPDVDMELLRKELDELWDTIHIAL